ncbi:DUF1858 domain-containing protein [Candidatus Woesearchaeota archaeon]|nr:DUF1858 domain-containing protein [Candidatus Woesearchaeota archaeon]MBW3005240.1 DUF1858 domain-containing protein [Candidatus Woesearchaeota archaeon]
MAEEIKKTDIIGDVVEKHEKLAPIFFKFGMHCIGCPAARGESIEDGAKAHGLDDEKIDALIKELNEELAKE